MNESEHTNLVINPSFKDTVVSSTDRSSILSSPRRDVTQQRMKYYSALKTHPHMANRKSFLALPE